MPFEFKIARAPPRQSSDKQLLFAIWRFVRVKVEIPVMMIALNPLLSSFSISVDNILVEPDSKYLFQEHKLQRLNNSKKTQEIC